MVDVTTSVLRVLIAEDEDFKNHVKFIVKTYHPQDKILERGKVYSHFCFLLKGTVRVVLSDDIEKTLHPIISEIYINDIFGAMGGFVGLPANADVIATTDAEVIEINTNSFLNFIEEHPKLGNKILMDFITVLFGRINRMNEKVLSILRQSLELQKKVKNKL